MGGGGSKVEYRDVYREPPPPEMLDTPWRDIGISKWDKKAVDDMRRFIQNYRPVAGKEHVNILLLGPIGTGKSSFFNTLDTSLSSSDAVKRRAGAGSETHSYTTVFHVYRLESEETLKFRICDCRGIESARSIPTEDVLAILDGHMKSGYEINPEAAIKRNHPKYRRNPNVQDKIHCIVWCFQATTSFEKLDDEERRQIKQMQGFARARDIGQLVLLSKTDQCVKVLESQIHKTFLSTDVKKSVESFAHSFGLPVSSVLPMKNYCTEVLKQTEVDILALFNLKQILGVANDSLANLVENDDDED
uniref:G domain-containing protein n=1 Tax=Pinctada fucata TaxID=50426 RepID=A0A194AMN7_PINFU